MVGQEQILTELKLIWLVILTVDLSAVILLFWALASISLYDRAYTVVAMEVFLKYDFFNRLKNAWKSYKTTNIELISE